LSILTRIIKYDKDGKVTSDIIFDYINGLSYPTPYRKMNPSRRDEK
jgi:hypothetical protein